MTRAVIAALLAHQHTISSGRVPFSALAGTFPPRTRTDSNITLTVERWVGLGLNKDAELWNASLFRYAVYPDLPPVQSIRGFRDLVKTARAAIQGPTFPPHFTATTGVPDSGAHIVRTVALQLRGEKEVKARIAAAAGVDSNGNHLPNVERASAVMILAGGHPLRSWSIIPKYDVLDALRMAEVMIKSGQLPPNLSLWSVSNPMAANTSRELDRLEQKIAAGARVILLQPPLLWDRWEHWLDEAKKRGITKTSALVVGLPIVGTPGELLLWRKLCGLSEATQILKDERAAAFEQQYREWLAESISKLKASEGVSGIHVMALSEKAQRLAKHLVRDGVINNKANGT